MPLGSGERMWACSFALDQALPSQRPESSAPGRLQQSASGQRDTVRLAVSRPRNHYECAKGTPIVMENSSVAEVPVWVASKKVPSGVSVYW